MVTGWRQRCRVHHWRRWSADLQCASPLRAHHRRRCRQRVPCDGVGGTADLRALPQRGRGEPAANRLGRLTLSDLVASQGLIQAVMEAEVAAKTGASFGERSPERYRNCYWAGLGTPVWARWSCRSRRCRRAATSPPFSNSAGATSAPCSSSCSRSTWRASPPAASRTSCKRLAATLSPRARSRASARSWTPLVDSFLGRPLYGGHYPLDALTQKVREDGRIVNVSTGQSRRE